jgi:hypothetical protein
MKKNIFKTIAILLIVAGVMACKKEKKEVFPQEILFTEYSLAGTSCQWSNFHYDDKAIVINSNAELEEYISCQENDMPAINFTTLSLLVFLEQSYPGLVISKRLIQTAPKKYLLHIDITNNMTAVSLPWSIAIITQKLPFDAEVTLKKNIID